MPLPKINPSSMRLAPEGRIQITDAREQPHSHWSAAEAHALQQNCNDDERVRKRDSAREAASETRGVQMGDEARTAAIRWADSGSIAELWGFVALPDFRDFTK
jgi:hypothetical protein